MRFLTLGVLLLATPAHAQVDTASALRIEASSSGTAPRTLTVDYDADVVGTLPDRLILRGQLRRANDAISARDARNNVVAQLARAGDTLFRGTFRIDENIVYGRFVVEDASGDWIDYNDGRYFEYIKAGADGRPAIEALLQRVIAHPDDVEKLASAEAAIRLYPDHPAGWYVLVTTTDALHGHSVAATAAEGARTAFDRIHRQSERNGRQSPEHVSDMFWLAHLLENADAVRHWRHILLQQYPDHPTSVRLRLADLRRSGHTAADQLAILEQMWSTPTAQGAALARAGWQLAQQIDSAAAYQAWAERLSEHQAELRGWLAFELARAPMHREIGMRHLEAELTRVRDGAEDERPLGSTRAIHRRDLRVRERTILGWIGEAQFAAGQVSDALATLQAATAAGWNPSALRALTEAQFSTGDIDGAWRTAALLAVDPAADAAANAGLERRLGHIAQTDWDALREHARRVMAERTLAEAIARPLELNIPLMTDAGSPTTLGVVLDHQPTVVLFWSLACPGSRERVPEVDALARTLAATGVSVIGLTLDKPTDAVRAYAAQLAFPVYYDGGRGAARAFGVWATPQIFVIDAHGSLRFEFTTVADTPRQLEALRLEDNDDDARS